MTLKFGVIGAGRIGKVHAENIQLRIPGAEVVAIADVVAEAAQQAAQDYQIAQASADYQDILSNPDIDAVVICSSTDTHAEIAMAAAQAGKHIFCEKPIDLTLAKIDAVLKAVEQTGVKFQVGFNRRFDANYARVRQAIVSGEVGEPHILHIISRDPAPPPIAYVKVSGGIFLDMMIHDFDMARFLVGSEIASVFVQGAVRVDPAIGEAGDIDTAVVMLTFANGVIGTIDNSRKAVYGYDQRVEVFGSGGMIATSNNYPNSAVVSNGGAIQRDLPLNFFMDRYTESYVSEMRAFIEVLRHDAPIPATGADGKQSIVAGLAAKQSLATGHPVRLADIS